MGGSFIDTVYQVDVDSVYEVVRDGNARALRPG
jgi:hypothetical protein